MNIIVTGAGKVGFTIAQQLTHEGHDVTIIDQDAERINLANSSIDAITICGSAGIDMLKMAGAEKADLLIAVTNSDETNILCCMVASKLGTKHTIARVRQQAHYDEVILLREELGLSMTICPEYTAAGEISRVLRFPSAAKVEPFAKGQAELVEFRLSPENSLCGRELNNFHNRFGRGTLVCAVRRNGKVHIPSGSFVLQAGDDVSVVGAPRHIHSLFKDMEIFKHSARYVLVVGGGHIGMYLARQLLGMGIHVKIMELDRVHSEFVKDQLPKAEVVCCDGSRPELLEEEGLKAMDAFVAVTGSDEINMIISAYAKNAGVDKVVCKVNEAHFIPIAQSFGLEEPVQPRYITAQQVLQYVRSMENASDSSGVEMLRRIMDGQLEVLEFRAKPASPCLNIPLKDLPTRPDVLLAAIIRAGKCFIPGGDDVIHVGDSVLAVTTKQGMTRLDDILRG